MKVCGIARRLTGATLVLVGLGGAAGAQPRPAAPAAPASSEGDADQEAARLKAAAKVHKDKGKALYNDGKFREAIEEYRKALELRRTGSVLANIAGCLRQLGQDDEALETYEEVLRDFKDRVLLDQVKLPVSELKAVMGTLVLAGDVPDGALLFIDNRLRGKLPLSAPLRLSKGLRKIRVEKEGFEPIAASVEVSAGKQGVATLAAKSKKGRLRVRERHNWPLAVEIDGKDVGGVTPWEGVVEPGEHRVRLHGHIGVEALLACEVPGGEPGEKEEAAEKGAKMESGVEVASVRLYEVKELVLGAEDRDASLKVESAPIGAELWIDGKELGRTPWEGRLGLGAHTIEVRAKGFVTKKQEVKLERRKQPEVTVALERETDLAALQAARNLRNVSAGAAYGLGALGLGLGVVTGVLVLDQANAIRKSCDGPNCPTSEGASVDGVRTLSTLSTVGFVVGGLGVAAGTVALLTLGPKAPERKTGTEGGGATRASSVVWKVGLGVGRVEIEGRF